MKLGPALPIRVVPTSAGGELAGPLFLLRFGMSLSVYAPRKMFCLPGFLFVLTRPLGRGKCADYGDI